MLTTRKPRIGKARKLLSNSQSHKYSFKHAKRNRALAVSPTWMIIILLLLVIIWIFIKLSWSSSTNVNPTQLNIAIVILLTKDPGISGGFLDSITSLSVSINNANSSHKLTKLALIHKDVTQCIGILQYFNYSILSRDIPITYANIENKRYAKELETDGCCGIVELLKLEVWTLDEYDYVLAMDADMLLHQNFDDIFEQMSVHNLANANKQVNPDPGTYHGKYLGWTHGATADQNQEVMNGGFLVVRPNMTHYKAMYALIKEGDFRPGSAWKGSHIGWCYGGRTIQGIVPYYYFGVLGKGNDDVELDRCVYNNMVEIEKCRQYEYKTVINNHFTWCQKPWYCSYQHHQPLCIQFNKQWWKTSRKVEDILKLKHREECPNNKYVAIDYSESAILHK
eukprot:69869_1